MAGSDNCNISIEHKEQFSILHVTGNVTGEADKKFNSAFDEASANTKQIVLEFSNSEYINSAGIAVLISLLKKSNDNDLKMSMAGLSKQFHKVIETVGLDDFIEIHGSVDDIVGRS